MHIHIHTSTYLQTYKLQTYISTYLPTWSHAGIRPVRFLQNHALIILISKNPFSVFARTSWQLFIFTTVLAL